MRTAKEIYLHVGVPLSADYLDKMRPEYRAFQESDIERILEEAILSARTGVRETSTKSMAGHSDSQL